MIIAIATQKGGTGKTATSISLAAGLVKPHHKKVILIDIGSQANSSKVLISNYQQLEEKQTIWATIINRDPLPVHPTSIQNLDFVPSKL